MRGKVYIWTYLENRSNYPGFNFTANNQACDDLIRVLDMMSEYDFLDRKSILLEEPTNLQLDVPNNKNGKAKWKSKNKLVLNYKRFEDDNYWEITENDKEFQIDFGKSKLEELRNAIIGIPKGFGDFPIRDIQHNNILYIWWNLEK